MLGLRVAVSQAQLDLRSGEADRAARRVEAALRCIPEDDRSADILEAERITLLLRSGEASPR